MSGRSWFNFGKDNNRAIDVEFNKELDRYYNQTRNTTPEQSKYIEPDFDETQEFLKDWKEHPENTEFGAPKLENVKLKEIDPLNPPLMLRNENEKKLRIPIPNKTRKQLTEIYNNICQYCKSQPIEQIHHLDKDPSNNELTNLLPLCYRCHKTIHKPVRIIPDKPRQRITHTRIYEREQEQKEGGSQ